MGTKESKISIQETDRITNERDLSGFTKDKVNYIEPADVVEDVIYKFILVEMKVRFAFFLIITILLIRCII